MSAALLALRTLLITPLAARCAAEGRDWATTRLTPRERDLWGQMRGRRSDEWLAGRIAAKDAVAALQISDGSHHPPSWPEITTSSSPEDRGRPLTSSPYHVSISHSHGLAAAAASFAPVGVDVEAHTRHWPREALELAGCITVRLPRPRDLMPAVAWSCAEAVLKQRGCGIKHGIDAVTLTRVTDEGFFEWTEQPPREGPDAEAPLKGRTYDLGSHALSFVWEPTTIGALDTARVHSSKSSGELSTTHEAVSHTGNSWPQEQVTMLFNNSWTRLPRNL